MATFRKYKKKDGSYSVTATIRMKGHQVFVETFTGSSRDAMADARAWSSDREAKLRYRKIGDERAGKISLANAFNSYFQHLEVTKRKKPTTIRGERWSRTQIEKKLSPETHLSDIISSTIAEYRDKRLGEGVGHSKIRSEMALISCLFKWAIQERSLPVENPVAAGKIWRPAAPKGRVAFLTIEQINQFLAACRKSTNKKLFAFVLVMLQTGMRPGEAASLRAMNINVKHRSITLFDTKNGKERNIPLTHAAFREISSHLIGKQQDEYLFFSGATMPATYRLKPGDRFRDQYDKAKKAAGLPWLTRHTLRHTAASHMIMRGVPLREIAEILGHSTLQMAMRYAHLDDDTVRKAIETIGDLGCSIAR